MLDARGAVEALGLVIPGVVRLGRLHVPVYGVFAAVGLMAALWLSQRTAARVGLAVEKVWDAGVFAVVAAFVASRVLLVLGDVRSFVRYPLLVLALPSLTYAGMAVTAALVWGYLRWKRLPVLAVVDAWAPCAAVLTAVLQVGHFVEGTEAGMPTGLPWGVRTPGDSVLGRVHPVQLYAALVALWLGWRWMRALRARRFAGQVAARALISGGLVAFLLDMLRQPVETQGSGWLEPGQYVALLTMLCGGVMLAWLYVREPQPSREEVATILEKFAQGRSDGYEHELVEFGRFDDPLLADVQEEVSGLFGPMNEEQRDEMLRQARRLRESNAPKPEEKR